MHPCCGVVEAQSGEGTGWVGNGDGSRIDALPGFCVPSFATNGKSALVLVGAATSAAGESRMLGGQKQSLSTHPSVFDEKNGDKINNDGERLYRYYRTVPPNARCWLVLSFVLFRRARSKWTGRESARSPASIYMFAISSPSAASASAALQHFSPQACPRC
ncbi:hypothetical protein PVAR5_4637 [Paecilomyces variotii No. 5]|uniref:Uncharacterized protein n=1 Tax=Byssochlamys spectabilis (strain No. 5 / NBRC 109023) TaxID=1356009 RepID=V5FVA2_BYSSN|nr:hypothetical protein PVAR5_4637 [Paecilomyces variotii No. 5]